MILTVLLRKIIQMLDSEYIKQTAKACGFSLCGVARCRPLDERKKFFDQWFAQGYDASLEYLRRHMDKRLDPSLLVEGAKTIVVCAVHYKNSAWNQPLERIPKIASYAYARDYHKTIKEMLFALLARIRERYGNVGGRCFTDTAPLLEKAWATEAGLGWIGKNSLLITPQYGSFILLGELVLDAEADCYDTPCRENRCGNCTACIDHCPAGAIRAPHIIDARRCISRLTIERLPEEEASDRHNLHGWIFGCDVCQSCCPHNARSPLHTLRTFDPVLDPAETTAAFWQNLTEEEFQRLFGETPLLRAGYHRIKTLL